MVNDQFKYDEKILDFMPKNIPYRSRRSANKHISHVDRVREMMSTAESYVDRAVVVSKEDKIRNEAIRLINEYYNKPSTNLGEKFYRDIVAFSVTCNTIEKNLEYVKLATNGVMPFCDKINGEKLNSLIDTCNEFVKSNPQFGIRKNHKTGKFEKVKALRHVDLSSVLMVGDTL